jgi:hypothetical protein
MKIDSHTEVLGLGLQCMDFEGHIIKFFIAIAREWDLGSESRITPRLRLQICPI